MNEQAWEQHLEHLPDEIAALRAEKLLLHSRLAKAKRRADIVTEQRNEALAKLNQAMTELRRLRAKEHQRR